MREVAAPRVPRTVNNITTANVAGPRTQRWFGDVAVVDWISYAVAIAPADVNLTVYSYAGRLSLGLVAPPRPCPTRPPSWPACRGRSTSCSAVTSSSTASEESRSRPSRNLSSHPPA